ncbi:universal stress protein [Nocardiopsis sp. CNT312]|uniref:universal stress protein n=1 Tax=Nocardiopsis sp. CNT312 TaxID=1137268 RepID=UPI00048C8755|nr:universal stress protein [Nocardiopsis sp. CNT312]
MSEQQRGHTVVVGVDGSPAAHAALEWAADAAARRGVGLRIVHGLGMPTEARGASDRDTEAEEARRYGRELLSDSAHLVQRIRPEVEAATVLSPEDGPDAVLHEARHGDVIVVGSRGLGAVRAIVHGSVTTRAASHAPCPVVAVPAHEDRPTPLDGPHEPRGVIVVGVDGSESSRRALRFGLDEALLGGASVEVVNSWEVPLPADVMALGTDVREAHEEVFDRQSEEIVAGVLAEVIDDRTERVDISAVRTQTDPVDSLVAAGDRADLVVVGSRGRGGVSGLVMGSVSQGVIRGSRIPVAVLPPHSEETE